MITWGEIKETTRRKKNIQNQFSQLYFSSFLAGNHTVISANETVPPTIFHQTFGLTKKLEKSVNGQKK
jgi:hypothetical protein